MTPLAVDKVLSPNKDASWLYFIQANEGGPIKIGASRDPHARLEAIQANCPFRLKILTMVFCDTPYGAWHLERKLHETFASGRLHGEWFRPCVRLVRYVEEARNGGDIHACLDNAKRRKQARERRKAPCGKQVSRGLLEASID